MPRTKQTVSRSSITWDEYQQGAKRGRARAVTNEEAEALIEERENTKRAKVSEERKIFSSTELLYLRDGVHSLINIAMNPIPSDHVTYNKRMATLAALIEVIDKDETNLVPGASPKSKQ